MLITSGTRPPRRSRQDQSPPVRHRMKSEQNDMFVPKTSHCLVCGGDQHVHIGGLVGCRESKDCNQQRNLYGVGCRSHAEGREL